MPHIPMTIGICGRSWEKCVQGQCQALLPIQHPHEFYPLFDTFLEKVSNLPRGTPGKSENSNPSVFCPQGLIPARLNTLTRNGAALSSPSLRSLLEEFSFSLIKLRGAVRFLQDMD
jgi:hypothetical protein